MSTLPIYIAVFLDKNSKQLLLPLAQYSEKHCDHCTLKWQPTTEDLERYNPLRKKIVQIKVIGLAQDQHCSAVLVELPPEIPCEKTIPHITLSCVTGTPPVYSDDMLTRAPTHPGEFTITGIVEYSFGIRPKIDEIIASIQRKKEKKK